MDLIEYNKIKTFNYIEYCNWLQNKYGKVPYRYFNENGEWESRNSRASEYLEIHHIHEDKVPGLSNRNTYKYQDPEYLVYCNKLEHLWLHVLICEENVNHNRCLSISGVVDKLIPSIKKIYSDNISNIILNNKEVFDIILNYFVNNSFIHQNYNTTASQLREAIKYEDKDKNIKYISLTPLFDHNIQLFESLEDYLNNFNSCVVDLCTCGGKTTTALYYANKYNLTKILVVVPKLVIGDSWKKYEGIETITYQALNLRYKEINWDNYELVILDEVHHGQGEEWGKAVKYILDKSKKFNLKVLGLSATLYNQADRKVVKELFENRVAKGIDLVKGIEEGIIHPFTYIGAYYKVSEMVEDFKKDFEPDLAEEDKTKLYGELDLTLNNTPELKDIILKHLPESKRKIIVFVKSIEAIDEAKAILSNIFNIESRILHSKLPDKEQEETIKWFEDTKEGIIYTVNMVNEGIHYTGINTLIMFRNTSSQTLFEQQLGRCIRLTQEENPNIIVYDLVNNSNRIQDANKRFNEMLKHQKSIIKVLGVGKKRKENILKSNQIIYQDWKQDILDVLGNIYKYSSNDWLEWEDNLIRDNKDKFNNNTDLVKYLIPLLPRHTFKGIETRIGDLIGRKKRNVWTEDEIRIFENFIFNQDNLKCYNYTDNLFKLLPNHTKGELSSRLKKYNISIYPFTKEEDNIIILKFPILGYKLKIKGRSKEQIKKRADFLGIFYSNSKQISSYTKEEDEIIIKYYPIEGPQGCAKRLNNRKPGNISSRAKLLGIIYNNPKLLTKEEKEIIKLNYPKIGIKVLDLLPGRTKSTIYAYAIHNNITYQYNIWQKEEDKILLNNPKASIEELLKLLPNKDKNQIMSRRQKLKIAKWEDRCKPVICIETKTKYPSASEASRQTNINNIDMCCRGQCKTAGGYHWEYIEEEEE